MPRKTLMVETLKSYVNSRLLDTPDPDSAGRRALMEIIEYALFETGNYRGFRYLCERDMRVSNSGSSVGINISNAEDVKFDPTQASVWENTDNTRVQYF